MSSCDIQLLSFLHTYILYSKVSEKRLTEQIYKAKTMARLSFCVFRVKIVVRGSVSLLILYPPHPPARTVRHTSPATTESGCTPTYPRRPSIRTQKQLK
jgi:hypothetical protein